ncbi:Ferric_reduct domain-containing protein/FAD_binding_8 domain-containing protein/NAD_binding_6 domain-containing protein/NADPH_Ox domain-containing protein [Cephalotus follicularis]|uniref:Ferric_reduct domain-containing protein/FAD_binding_8 domain-containing protein/NAD_binding_6 domain-containing protein/NADPH_Ox domain-containing protein n=1 Tax=Cephalotus follicularis TaxID=3775 RepID=A0A1Q3BSL2_CEPFO|nr:Ferric_reduct domain-containing protein/FAD_binding_8 domain-containing protein/NAD_binding_6 domain-containing protein/NADPH_Ox domain-containing protein [Cephalotus follicularis]
MYMLPVERERNNNNATSDTKKKLSDYLKMRQTSSSFCRSSSSKLSNNYRRSFDLPSDHEDAASESSEYGVGGAMLPIFLNDLRRNSGSDLVEVTLELDNDSVVVCSVNTPTTTKPTGNGIDDDVERNLWRSLSAGSRIRRKLGWLRSGSSRSSSTSSWVIDDQERAIAARDARKMHAELQRTTSSAQRALKGLRFISKNRGVSDAADVSWRYVEARFHSLAKDGLLAREDFGECIGMVDSKEFALGIFDALARWRRQKIAKITKDELHHFWLQLSDHSFDARLQIFFDMADSNEDGRITREEVQELIMLSASANKLSKLKEQAEEYASLIMEELDPENLGYIELWQLETLLLQRDTYMNYSRPLSTASVGWSQNLSTYRPINVFRKLRCRFQCLILENWQRAWILVMWVMAIALLFSWKFDQYRNMAAFHVMGNCLAVAKGAAETLKFNMALILLPVCRNTLTWLRSTRARSFVPFDDNINFHKMIACAIAIGIILHAGNHLACDFPRIVNASPEKFAYIATDFRNDKQPTYKELLAGTEGVTGISMVVLMSIAFILATSHFRRNLVRLPAPFNRLTGFNAFWYTHHLLGLVYLLLLVHGAFLYLVHKWYQKTTWMYLTVPLLLYIAERIIRTRRSEFYSVKILKVSVLPGNVFSLIMSKPQGFKYKSGQYIFLQCPTISPFEWHPFSITSAPGDNYLSVHIRTVGDWTQELKRVFTEVNDSACVIGRAQFCQLGHIDHRGQPRLLVDGPYGAPAQDYRNYDVLLLVGLGIGATPFISVLRDLLNNTRAEEQMDLNTEASRSDDTTNSCTSSNLTPGSSSTTGGKKKSQRATSAHFYWVTREPGSFEWFKGVMDEVADMDHKGQIELHNYLTSVYEEGDARSTLITMVQALNHAKHGVDILSGTRVRTHFARPNWKEVFTKIASKHPYATVGVFYCGMPVLAKELKQLSHVLSHKTSTRFEFHKEYF